MRAVIYTSGRSVSLMRVAEDVARVFEEEGVRVCRLVSAPDFHPFNYDDCNAAVTVMTFDPIWASPYFAASYLMKTEGLETLIYTTIEGFPRRFPNDSWIYDNLEFVANSEYTRSRLKKSGARVKAVVHHGVFLEDIQALHPMRQRMREYMGFSKDDFIVGYLAGSYRRKGHDLLAEAIREVGERDPTVKFLVITQQPAVEAYAKLSNCTVSDEFGKLSQDFIYGFYHMVDLYVQASTAEGFGLPVLEAIAAGTPVVHPAYSPLTEITDEKCSFRVPVSVVAIDRTSHQLHVGIDYELHIYDPVQMAEAILEAKDAVARDREEYRARCLERAKLFHARNTYKQLLSALLR